MDWKKELTKAILGLGISVLKYLIPWLGSLLGGPLGIVAGWAVSYLTGLLYDMVERYMRLAAIDNEVKKQIEIAKEETKNFEAIQKNNEATIEEKSVAKEKLRLALITLGRIKLRPN
jgi:hypothetical protein